MHKDGLDKLLKLGRQLFVNGVITGLLTPVRPENMIARRSCERYGNLSSVADAENHRTSYTLLSTNFGRHQQRNSPAFVLAVNLEIVIEGDDRTAVFQFSHPYQASIRKRYGDIPVLLQQDRNP